MEHPANWPFGRGGPNKIPCLPRVGRTTIPSKVRKKWEIKETPNRISLIEI